MELPKNFKNLPQELKNAWLKFMGKWKEIPSYRENIVEVNKPVGRIELENLLQNNVCEIVFERRRPEREPHRPEFRRMLCTNCMGVLNTRNGKRNLRWRAPRHAPSFNPLEHNIVIVWDVMMKDYRNVSMDNCILVQTIPGDDTFWQYFNESIMTLSPAQQMSFMDDV